MGPFTLAEVLHLEQQPTLQKATIVGYHCKLWGSYPALLDGPFGGKVHGVVFEVQSPEQVKLLQDYETERYELVACQIQLENGEKVSGKTFMWGGSEEELEGGELDLEDSRMRCAERELGDGTVI